MTKIMFSTDIASTFMSCAIQLLSSGSIYFYSVTTCLNIRSASINYPAVGLPRSPLSTAHAFLYFQQEPAVLFAVTSTTGTEKQQEGNSTSTSKEKNKTSTFAFSALPHLAEDLAEQMHPESLTLRPVTAVSLDHRLMGAGGDDSWSACVHDEFLIRPGNFNFGFAVAPYWRRVDSNTSVSEGGGGGEGGGEAAECWRGVRCILDR